MRVNTVVVYLDIEEAAFAEHIITQILTHLPPPGDWPRPKITFVMSLDDRGRYTIEARSDIAQNSKSTRSSIKIFSLGSYDMPKGISARGLLDYIAVKVHQLLLIRDPSTKIDLGLPREPLNVRNPRFASIDLTRL